MWLVYKFWSTITFLSSVILFSISGRIDGIIGSSFVVGIEGQGIIIMWNTTNCVPIKSAIFGLSNEGMADPQFINVNTLTGEVHHNPKISKVYFGRVDFVGNLTAGHAWFIIKKLHVNDTNEYLARITIDVDTVKSYTVRLRVKKRNELRPKTDNHLASTVTSILNNELRPSNKTSGNEPTSSGPNKKVIDVIKYTLGLVIIFVLIWTLGTYCLWKRKKSKHDEKQEGNSLDSCSKSQAKESLSPDSCSKLQAKESLISNNKENNLENQNLVPGEL